MGGGDGPGGKKSCHPADREEESDSDGEMDVEGSSTLPFTPDFREVSTCLSH